MNDSLVLAFARDPLSSHSSCRPHPHPTTTSRARDVDLSIVTKSVDTHHHIARRRSRAMSRSIALGFARAHASSVARAMRDDVVHAKRPRATLHRERHGYDWTTNDAGDARARERANERANEVEDDDGEERWKYAHESDAYAFRGSWLDLVATQRGTTSGVATGGGRTEAGDAFENDGDFEAKIRKMRRKAAKRRIRDGTSADGFVMGGAEYEAVLGELVEAHVRLARTLTLWRANFVVRFAREPDYADMPVRVRNIELDWISLGFKIRSIEK